MKINLIISISIILCILALIWGIFLRHSPDIDKMEKPRPNVLKENPVDTTITMVTNQKKWFPIPIVSVEKNTGKEGKYFIVFENGMGVYYNKKYTINDTILWMDEDGNITSKIDDK